MVFTKTEIDIAKQIVKVAVFILVLFTAVTFLGKLIYGFDTGVTPDVQKTAITPVEPIKPGSNVSSEVPLSIEIPGYSVNSAVEAPQTTNTEKLDEALSRGPVYYPGSGTPGSNNTLIFGHSTSFKIVVNKAYQTFNDIKNVAPGTLIYVKTASATHIYKTRDVKKVSKYTSWIQFASEKPMLTLATCDSFGKASDRWVLQADYVGVQ